MKHELFALILMAALFALPILAGLFRMRFRPHGIDVSNSGAAGAFEGPVITRSAEAAINAYLLLKPGTAPGTQANVNAATDDPIGTATDKVSSGAPVGVRLLGGGTTHIMIGSKAIAAGARVFTTASGKVTDTAVNNSYLVGRALTACGADGDEFEVLTCFPVRQTV
jgi:hypothetical protein